MDRGTSGRHPSGDEGSPQPRLVSEAGPASSRRAALHSHCGDKGCYIPGAGPDFPRAYFTDLLKRRATGIGLTLPLGWKPEKLREAETQRADTQRVEEERQRIEAAKAALTPESWRSCIRRHSPCRTGAHEPQTWEGPDDSADSQ